MRSCDSGTVKPQPTNVLLRTELRTERKLITRKRTFIRAKNDLYEVRDLPSVPRPESPRGSAKEGMTDRPGGCQGPQRKDRILMKGPIRTLIAVTYRQEAGQHLFKAIGSKVLKQGHSVFKQRRNAVLAE